MEGQERNIVQLERIEAVIEWRWGWKGENRKEKSGDEKEGSKNSSGKSREERTSSFVSC